jgi:hypothetical protein
MTSRSLCARARSMASGDHMPASFSGVLAEDRKPCALISSLLKPSRRRAPVTVFSRIGLSRAPWAGKTYRPLPVRNWANFPHLSKSPLKGPHSSAAAGEHTRAAAAATATATAEKTSRFQESGDCWRTSANNGVVPRRGLEPPRPCERQHLKLVRLPIPPPGHRSKEISSVGRAIWRRRGRLSMRFARGKGSGHVR